MRNFITAARPKTLLAGIIPPTVAYVYFISRTGQSEILLYLLCLFGALFIQLATNFFNDVIDHEKGADLKRVGPLRVSSAGLVSLKQVRIWAYGSIVAAMFCGIPLIIRGGLPFLILGMLSLYLTYGYTGGKISLAYRGLGELFVFLFFGLFSVLGSFYLFALNLDLKVVLIASMMGSLSTTFIGINNLRDRETDSEVGKKTLATRTKYGSYQGFIIFTIILPYFLLFPLLQSIQGFSVMLALLPAAKLISITLRNKGSDLNEGLKFSGIHLIIFSFLICLNFIYGNIL
jgi:1,4-dihydroxy-2-naphthoate polyprenyltransferase